MSLKTTSEVRNRINEILAERENENQQMLDNIEKAQTAADEAAERMKKTIIEGSISEYQTAKSDKATADEMSDIYSKRLDYLKGKELITKEEYESLSSKIFDEASKANDKAVKQLIELSEKMFEIAEELENSFFEANEVLHILQNDVYRNADRCLNQNGDPLVMHDALMLHNWDAVRWGKAGISHYGYRKYAHKDRPKTRAEKADENRLVFG